MGGDGRGAGDVTIVIGILMLLMGLVGVGTGLRLIYDGVRETDPGAVLLGLMFLFIVAVVAQNVVGT